MGYFPFYIDIESKNCLVVGGGAVALRKIEKLVPFNPNITVVAPRICDEIRAIDAVKAISRPFVDNDTDDAFFVISATDDRELNEHIFRLCSDKNILVNTVDDREYCGFIFPSLAKKENITVGITTSGKSPIFARYLREQIESIIGNGSEKIVEALSKYRPLVKSEIPTEENRKEAFERLLTLCIHDRLPIDENSVLKIIEDLK